MVSAQLIADAVLVVTLLMAAVTDVRRGRVYNWTVYPAAVLGLALWIGAGFYSAGWSGAGSQAGQIGLSLLAGFGPMLVVFAFGGIGGGDAKLTGAAAILLCDWKLTVTMLVYSFLAGGVMSVYVMIRRRIVARTLRRIWWFFWVVLLPGGRPGSPTDKASPRIPFGVALCVGGLWLLAEQRMAGGHTLLDRLLGL